MVGVQDLSFQFFFADFMWKMKSYLRPWPREEVPIIVLTHLVLLDNFKSIYLVIWWY